MKDCPSIPEPLLAFAWQHGMFDCRELYTRDGERVEVVAPGRRNIIPGPDFTDAQIRIGGKTYVGKVAVHEKSSGWGYHKRNYDPHYDEVILQVVAEDDRIVHKVDDTVLPSVRLILPERLIRAYRTLLLGAEKAACGYYMTRKLSDIEFKSACTRLMIDRLERKFNDVMSIHRTVEKNWHETFHVLFFRSMGLGKNKDIYMSLARSVPYAKLCQERGDIQNIEAMLFGVAGLLDPSLYDEYKSALSQRFEVLRHRHQLRVMTYCEWSDKGVRPYNFVPKRIAQLASMINSEEFSFNHLLACGSVEEARGLFRVELPDYWKRALAFGRRIEKQQKTTGEDTIDILIINLVAPILFTYGRIEGRDDLEERAIDFLYATKPEKNRYTEGWRRRGVPVEHALASQALIQLTTEFCLSQRCAECFLGARLLKDSL